MTRDEIHALLKDLHLAQAALQDSGAAFDAALDAIREANHAQGKAIDAIVRATAQALAAFSGPAQ